LVRAATAILLASSIAAQTPPSGSSTAAGTRIRLKTADRVDQRGHTEGAVHVWLGTFAEERGDTVVIHAADGRLLLLPKAQIASFERYEGPRTHRARGALIGAAAGVGVGIVMVAFGPPYIEYCSRDNVDFFGHPTSERFCYQQPLTTGELWLLGAIWSPLMGAIGAGVGALAGSVKHDHWKTVELRDSRVSVTPIWNGARIGLQVGW
jgi:hypothetical protein